MNDDLKSTSKQVKQNKGHCVEKFQTFIFSYFDERFELIHMNAMFSHFYLIHMNTIEELIVCNP